MQPSTVLYTEKSVLTWLMQRDASLAMAMSGSGQLSFTERFTSNLTH